MHYYISGHDHHHSESIVTSPDGRNAVHQIICASDSNKFYALKPPFSDHEKPISLKLQQIGYYLCTVDGPHVTMDYYAVDVSGQLDQAQNFKTTPQLTGNWKKIFTSSYSLEDQQPAR